MKRLVLLAVFCISLATIFANGVVVASNMSVCNYIRLTRTSYDATVTNQAASVKCTETFRNTLSLTITPRLYFPKPRGSHVTSLRWKTSGEWHTATLAELEESPPGVSFPFPDQFVLHMQLMPLIFQPVLQLAQGQDITFEVTYIYMLDYNFGTVNLNLRNDYSRIQSYPLDLQEMVVNVSSDRSILDFDVLDLDALELFTPSSATASYTLGYCAAVSDYNIIISLSTNQLGSNVMSTFQNQVPDTGSHGFFLLTTEEQAIPADSVYNATVIVLIDVSGSMTFENRLENAKVAASYVINNLGTNDRFNIILFDHVIHRLWQTPQENNETNRQSALSYVNNYTIVSLNGTNLEGGLYASLVQFNAPSPSSKNLLILLSDGQPNVGITDSYQIVNRVDSTVSATNSQAYIFSIGIGLDVNYPLLNMIALHHKGVAMFVQSNALSDCVASFYSVMRNPNILFPNLQISNPGIISEVFPIQVAAVYGGVQYRIVGRYSSPQPFTVNISGLHEGDPVSYSYPITPASTEVAEYSFLPKLWASAKIDQLMLIYYSYPVDSAIALEYKQMIIALSLAYGIPTVFTSYVDPPSDIEDNDTPPPAAPIVLHQNYPNPFNPSTIIAFDVTGPNDGSAVIEIYNLKGQLVRRIRIEINRTGRFEVLFDGKDQSGSELPSGVYLYKLILGDYTLTKRMILSK